ncbi:MAG: AAC(3) family N-acetyltransferase [Lachnospira sp.]|nr:AAC(3) family N-acetyltransferase [Lachnospira sp.]
MFYKVDLVSQIRKLGIQQGDILLVHSSMKAIGEVEGGADTVLDALTEAVCGQDAGMLVLPTHTWATMTKEHDVYDPDVEPACVGILPNLFMKRTGVVRSLHPTHSVAAYSKVDGLAKQFVSGEEKFTTPCNRNGCYGKLYDMDAKILLLGVGLNRNTYMHGVEEWFGITERLTDETLKLTIRIPVDMVEPIKDMNQQHHDTYNLDVEMHKHFKPNNISISENYVRLEQTFMDEGALLKGMIGDAECMLMSAQGIADITTEHLKMNRDYFL